jgi:hypothetical protein
MNPGTFVLLDGLSNPATFTNKTTALSVPTSGGQRLHQCYMGDGQRIFAELAQDAMYASTNGGSTFTKKVPSIGGFFGLAATADGTKMLYGEITDLLTSTDSGDTWTVKRTATSSAGFRGVAMSGDGTIMGACARGDNLGAGSVVLKSTDSGSTWTSVHTAGKTYIGVVMNADGSKWVAISQTLDANNLGAIYVSADSAATWQIKSTRASYLSVVVSADRSMVAVSDMTGRIIVSNDFGQTWLDTSVPVANPVLLPEQLAINADGTQIAFVDIASNKLYSCGGYA